MKMPSKEECKSCWFVFVINSSVGNCNALDCKGTRNMMRKIDDKRRMKNARNKETS